MDWSVTTSFLIGLFVGWLVEYLIDYFFWRRERDSDDVQALRLRLRDTEAELANAKTQIRSLQANLVQAEERTAAQTSSVNANGAGDAPQSSELATSGE